MIIKYFIDTEFNERPGSIDLISIGIVCDDGSTLVNYQQGVR